MIVLTAEQASHVIYRDQFDHARLRPVLLSDGRYAVPENVLNDPRHARHHNILRAGSIEAAGTLTVVNTGSEDTYKVTVDGKVLELGFATGFSPARGYTYPQRGPFDIPATGLYRFLAQYNNDHVSYDWVNNRRRVELTQNDDTGPVMGNTWWSSFSLVMTDDYRSAFLGPNGTLIHQWFHTGTITGEHGPFVWLALDGTGQLYICARSSADAYPAQHNYYVENFAPPSGVPTHFVMSGLLGNPGHLNVWMNGVQIVNASDPLGFYGTASPNVPAYMHCAWGIYQGNVSQNALLYFANIEFGTTSLAARVAVPLAVSAPPEGWGPAVVYPEATSLYPNTTVYPDTVTFPRA